jgi:hypothetical protein
MHIYYYYYYYYYIIVTTTTVVLDITQDVRILMLYLSFSRRVSNITQSVIGPIRMKNNTTRSFTAVILSNEIATIARMLLYTEW